MKLEIAKAIVAAGVELGLADDEMSLRENYSGRGMYGRETAGVEYQHHTDLLRAVALAAYLIGRPLDPEEEPEDSGHDKLDRELRNLRTEQMGLGMIAY